jgi:hypothetical protein
VVTRATVQAGIDAPAGPPDRRRAQISRAVAAGFIPTSLHAFSTAQVRRT